MFEYPFSNLFYQDSTDKQLHIYYDNRQGHITNVDLHSQEFSLQESICSDSQLHFGNCEASCLTFKIANKGVSLKGKNIQVEMVIGGHTENPLKIGTYIVDSDVPTADRRARAITAYDVLYKVINDDVLDWYNALPNTFTLKAFRDSFFGRYGIVQENVTLPNDAITINKVELSDLTGKQVLEAICELNGCFGHISRDNVFKYIYLSEIVEGLYPRNDLYPKNDLYPLSEIVGASIEKQSYISVDYEDFNVKAIDRLKIWNNSNEQITEYGTGNNVYDIENNILAYGLDANSAYAALSNIYARLNKIWYMPVKAVEAVGNPCIEVGDSVRLNTSDKIIYTYVLDRKISGIQSLRDSFSASGEEVRIRNVNSLENRVNNIVATTEVIKSNVEETNFNLGQTNSNLEATNGVVSGHTTQIGGLTTTVDAQGRTINTLNGSINTINGEINTINGNVNNINGSINNITGEVNTIKGNVNNISGRVTNVEGGVANINTEITNINSSITNINGTLNVHGTAIAKKIEASYINAEHICGALTSPDQGSITVGTVRAASFWYYDGQNYLRMVRKYSSAIGGYYMGFN